MTAAQSGGSSAPLSRIHIVGGAGSGKTTLARQIAAARGITPHDLDRVWFDYSTRTARSFEERTTAAAAIALGPAWVTEGVSLWWTEPLMRRAEVIVWLDLPWRIAAWRIVRRHLLADLAGQNEHPGYGLLLGFLRRTRTYYAEPLPRPHQAGPSLESRAWTRQVLRPHAAKVVRARRPADVARLARRLAAGGGRPTTVGVGCDE